MLDYLLQYALFLAETLTIVAAVAALVILVAVLAARRRAGAGSETARGARPRARYREMKHVLESGLLRGKERKAAAKARKREARARAKGSRPDRPRVFVLDFKGDIRASAVSSLREEVTAVLAHARPEDEVLVRLESAGGLVHDHGLAASQLMRVRERGIPLTVSVDRIAASGGYMMACVADRILAAPFAILGSIGVLAQIPNFHRMLDSHGIDFEQFKGGEYKRTVTMFGENTDADRAKLAQDIEEIHGIFKRFVTEAASGSRHREGRHRRALARASREGPRTLRRARHERRLPPRGERAGRSRRGPLRGPQAARGPARGVGDRVRGRRRGRAVGEREGPAPVAVRHPRVIYPPSADNKGAIHAMERGLIWTSRQSIVRSP